jgi:hypothetical protein
LLKYAKFKYLLEKQALISNEYYIYIGNFLSRTSILKDILKIENEIKKIQHNSQFRILSRNLRQLKSHYNRGYISVPSPDNFETTIKVRKDSQEMMELVTKYQEKYDEFSERLFELQEMRKILRNKIFC